MKVVWAIVLLLVVGAAVAFWPEKDERTLSDGRSSELTPAPAADQNAPGQRAPGQTAPNQSTSSSSQTRQPAGASGSRTTSPSGTTGSGGDAAQNLVDDLMASVREREERDAAGGGAAAIGDAGAGEMPLVDPSELTEGTIEQMDDGSVLLDGKFVIRGSGTREDPYLITWDLLTSAYLSYRPREGMTEIPARIEYLHDKYVKIEGYLAYPILTEQTDEVLVMLNQWDGCCFGVPPTPYDGIEAKLTNPVPNRGGLSIFNWGSMEGRLVVDPYLVNDWLIGLFLMEDAKLQLDE